MANYITIHIYQVSLKLLAKKKRQQKLINILDS